MCGACTRDFRQRFTGTVAWSSSWSRRRGRAISTSSSTVEAPCWPRTSRTRSASRAGSEATPPGSRPCRKDSHLSQLARNRRPRDRGGYGLVPRVFDTLRGVRGLCRQARGSDRSGVARQFLQMRQRHLSSSLGRMVASRRAEFSCACQLRQDNVPAGFGRTGFLANLGCVAFLPVLAIFMRLPTSAG